MGLLRGVPEASTVGRGNLDTEMNMVLDGITYVFRGDKRKNVVTIDYANSDASPGITSWPAIVNGSPVRLNFPNGRTPTFPTPEFVQQQLLPNAE